MRRGQKTTRWRQSASGYLLEQGQVDLIRLQMHSLLIWWIDWSCHHTGESRQGSSAGSFYLLRCNCTPFCHAVDTSFLRENRASL
jgi:hypothetical protein